MLRQTSGTKIAMEGDLISVFLSLTPCSVSPHPNHLIILFAWCRLVSSLTVLKTAEDRYHVEVKDPLSTERSAQHDSSLWQASGPGQCQPFEILRLLDAHVVGYTITGEYH